MGAKGLFFRGFWLKIETVIKRKKTGEKNEIHC